MKCKHCYIPNHDNYGLSIDEIKQIVRQAKELKVFDINLTGGEIFLRKDILDIIKYIRKNYIRVSLKSNATMINESIISQLADLNVYEYAISVYSLDEKIHDYITSQKGSLKKTLKNIEILKKYNIPVAISCPVMNINCKSVTDIMEYCKNNNFRCDFTPSITKRTNGDDMPYKLLMNDEEYKKYVDETTTKENFDDLINRKLGMNEKPCKFINCGLFISSYGDVYPCISLPYKLGNVNKDSLRDIW